MSKRITVLLLVSTLLFAQDLSRRDVLGGTALSAGITLLTLTEAGMISEEDAESNDLPWWIYTTIGTQHLPLYSQNKSMGLQFSLIEGSTLMVQRLSLGHETMNDIALNYYLKTSFYSTYAIYKNLREQAGGDVYQDSWKSYTATDLALAPFKWEHLSRKEFIRPFLLIGAISWLTTDKPNPVWDTKRAEVDGRSFPTPTATAISLGSNMILMAATAVGEEALFRGVIYEELKQSIGQKKARMADALLFPAIHLPQEIAAGAETGDMVVNFVFRSVLTWILDASYDAGGLPLSTTLHFWNNTLSRTLRWGGESGVPSMNIKHWQQNQSPQMIRFSVTF